MIETAKLRSLLKELDKALDADRFILAAALCREIDEESARIAQECMTPILTTKADENR